MDLHPDGLISASSPPRLQGSVGAAGRVCSPLAQEPLSTLSWHPGMLLGRAQGLWCFHWAPGSVLLWEEENRPGVSHIQQVHGPCEYAKYVFILSARSNDVLFFCLILGIIISMVLPIKL